MIKSLPNVPGLVAEKVSAFNNLEVGGCVSKLGNCKYDEKKLLF